MKRLSVLPLTEERWPAFTDLFGRSGACNGCWCMYWRIGSAYHRRARGANKGALHRIVRRGPSPGLLAFDLTAPPVGSAAGRSGAANVDGNRAIGWCQLTPRGDLPWLERTFPAIDAAPVWSLTCFYVRAGHRRSGVMTALIDGAIARVGSGILEAYPVDTEAPGATRNVFTGTLAAFERAGFRVVARSKRDRLIVRRQIG